MANVQGIAITIKAFLPTGKTLDDQFAAISLVRDAHASGDYSAVLKAATIDEVKSENKTRRVDEQPQSSRDDPGQDGGEGKAPDGGDDSGQAEPGPNPPAGNSADDSDVPAFLKKGRSKTA